MLTISPNTMQWLSQQGFLRHIMIEDGGRATSYMLVPTTHWHNSNKFPHEVEKDLKQHSFKRTVIEGLEYYLVPDPTINGVGQVSRYAYPEKSDYASEPVSTAPEAVSKYLKRERKIQRQK